MLFRSLNNRVIAWSASNNRITVQSNTGNTTIVRANSSGDATLTASSEGKSSTANIHVRTYCEQNVCASRWRVENYSNKIYDVYQIECSSSSCTNWVFVDNVTPGHYLQSLELTENHAYQVRAVTLGCDPTTLNCLKMEALPFVGGPGPVAVFKMF